MPAAVGPAPGASAAWLAFNMRPRAYNEESIIDCLEDLYDQPQDDKVTLTRDPVASQRSEVKPAQIADKRHWLVVERLGGVTNDLG